MKIESFILFAFSLFMKIESFILIAFDFWGKIKFLILIVFSGSVKIEIKPFNPAGSAAGSPDKVDSGEDEDVKYRNENWSVLKVGMFVKY